MVIEYVRELLRNTDRQRIVTSDKVKLKIEITHNLRFEDIAQQLLNTRALEAAEEQGSRAENERTFRVVFKKSSQRKLCIVITEKPDGTVFVVTAFESSKRLDKLIKTQRTRRR